ncbi:MAG: hypothetical protein JWR37_2532 [Mycobacterium sp.]|nr:hypothetical protein [Mycobacterium sp.]
MATRALARTGELVSQDLLQRMLAASQTPLADCPVLGSPNIGTGFSAGVVGKMNGHATRLMRTIAAGHVRVSLALAFISISNTIVGVSGLILHYRPTEWLATVTGVAFLAYFLLSEGLLTLLAAHDLRIRRGWAGDPGDKP